jgi:hypothetical protein
MNNASNPRGKRRVRAQIIMETGRLDFGENA